jgi:DNA-binding transcriptional regulator LsrR (DeoR family)
MDKHGTYNYALSEQQMQQYWTWTAQRDPIIRDAYKHGWSKRAIARRMGLARQTVINVLNK